MTDYVLQNEYLDSPLADSFPVEGLVRRAVFDGKSRVSMYGSWKMRTAEWGKPSMHRVQVKLESFFYRGVKNEMCYDAGKPCSRSQRWPCRVSWYIIILSVGYLVRLPGFQSCSLIWREVLMYDVGHRVGDDYTYPS